MKQHLFIGSYRQQSALYFNALLFMCSQFEFSMLRLQTSKFGTKESQFGIFIPVKASQAWSNQKIGGGGGSLPLISKQIKDIQR